MFRWLNNTVLMQFALTTVHHRWASCLAQWSCKTFYTTDLCRHCEKFRAHYKLRNHTLSCFSSALFTSVIYVRACVCLYMCSHGCMACNHLLYRIHTVHFVDCAHVVQVSPPNCMLHQKEIKVAVMDYLHLIKLLQVLYNK